MTEALGKILDLILGCIRVIFEVIFGWKVQNNSSIYAMNDKKCIILKNYWKLFRIINIILCQL